MPDTTSVSRRTVAYPNAETTGSGPPSWDDAFPPELTEQRKQALLAYWRDVFSGAAEPEVLPIPPVVEEVVRRKFPGKHSEAFWREANEEYAMRWFYGCFPVTYVETPRGCVIIAIGNYEAALLNQSVPWKVIDTRTRTTFPPSWEEVVE